MKTLIIGASNKPERYAYLAFTLLKEYGHETVLMHPKLTQIDAHPVYNTLNDIKETIDTITLYVNATVSSTMQTDILNLKPRRVIFNPGAENDVLKKELEAHHILCLNACTLVLLKTNQY